MIKKLQVKSKKFERNKGMTLFIAVTVMAILLIISYAVINIAIKGSQFATSGRDSQFAFYAADAGLECALYWDSKTDAFATTTGNATVAITCGGIANAISTGSQNPVSGSTTAISLIGGGGDANQTSVFGFTMIFGSNPVPHCAIVTVRKYYVGLNLTTYIK